LGQVYFSTPAKPEMIPFVAMDILFVSTISILAIECFLYLPFSKLGKFLLISIKKSVRVVTSQRISDHWKEIVLIRYASEIMKTTLYIFFILLGLLLLIIAGSLIFDLLVGQKRTAINALSQPWNWGIMTLVASIYLYFRNRYAKR
jgi:hypothetical protein